MGQPNLEVLEEVVRVAGQVRQFKTGATRDTDQGKLVYTGFLNPFVTKRFAEYMHKHRQQSDGSLRAPDNWQKGIPRQAYMESLGRHVEEIKQLHEAMRGHDPAAWGQQPNNNEAILETLMAVIFNAQGMALEIMKGTAIEEAA